MSAFFNSDELAMMLRHISSADDADIDDDTATFLANLASDEIRDDLNQKIDRVTGDTITLFGDGGELIMLPERPVTAVTSVLLGGIPVDAFDWRTNGALRRVLYPGSQFANELIWCWPFGVPIQVTYDHGFVTVPNAIKAAALDLAISMYIHPDSSVSSKTVDDVTEAYRATRASSMLSDERRSSLDKYRNLEV